MTELEEEIGVFTGNCVAATINSPAALRGTLRFAKVPNKRKAA